MEIKTTPKKFCFVLMPFSEDFKDIYELGIKEACDKAGAYCERVDEQHFDERILDRIYNQISKADIVIADMTGKNANVFYEVGYAHALGKTTVLLTQDVKDIPFDFLHFPHIIYKKSIIDLKEVLEKRIQWALKNSNQVQEISTIDFEIYSQSQNISAGNVNFHISYRVHAEIELTLHNKSFQTYSSLDYQIAVITSDLFPLTNGAGNKTLILPDGKLMHMLVNPKNILFPNSFQPLYFLLGRNENRTNGPDYHEEQIIIRIFTSSGSRDYPFSITSVL